MEASGGRIVIWRRRKTAGLTAAIYLARAQYRVLVLEKETIGGQITITAEVVNYPSVFSTDGKRLTEEMRRQVFFGKKGIFQFLTIPEDGRGKSAACESRPAEL